MGTECRLDVHRSPSPVYFSERCTQEPRTIIETRHECISFIGMTCRLLFPAPNDSQWRIGSIIVGRRVVLNSTLRLEVSCLQFYFGSDLRLTFLSLPLRL